MSLETLQPPFSRRAEVDALAKRFVSLSVGDSLSYSQVKDVIGVNAQTETGRGITTAARMLVQRESSVVIECLRKVGFKRASDPEKISLAKTHVGKIRRNVRRGSKILRATHTENLNQDERSQYTISVAIFGALNQATRPKILKDVEKALNASSDIKYGDVLQLVLSKSVNGKK
jgi:hypothetical protein